MTTEYNLENYERIPEEDELPRAREPASFPDELGRVGKQEEP